MWKCILWYFLEIELQLHAPNFIYTGRIKVTQLKKKKVRNLYGIVSPNHWEMVVLQVAACVTIGIYWLYGGNRC